MDEYYNALTKRGMGANMDRFVDKIAQKMNSQDIIRANAEAEAAQMKRLRNQTEQMRLQLEQNDACMQEMRKLGLRNLESAQILQTLAEDARSIQEMLRSDAVETGSKLNRLAEECITRLNAIQEQDFGNNDILDGLEEVRTLLKEYRNDIEASGLSVDDKNSIQETHRVSFYNQSAIDDVKQLLGEHKNDHEEILKLLGDIKAVPEDALKMLLSNITDELKNELKSELIMELKTEIEEIVHKENVKVYRNVQAVVVEELGKQIKETSQSLEQAAGKSKKMLIMILISMLIGLGNLGILIAQAAGLF